jgi:type VI secretion system protein ImpG
VLDLITYFAWPEAFAFVDLGDLARLTQAPSYEIAIRLRDPLPVSIQPEATSLRLHCVPAYNVYRAPTLNLQLAGTRCAVETGNNETQIYAIEKVALVRSDLTAHPVEPFARFFPPPLLPDGRMPLLYRVERSPSVVGAWMTTELSFVSVDPRSVLEKVASVDVDILATDGARASRLAPGDICVPTAKSPSLVSFRNITPVTRSAPALLAEDRLWRWLKLLRSTFAELTDADCLGDALALQNIAAASSWPEAKPDEASFRPLLSVSAERSMRPGRDDAAPFARVSVQLDTDGFSGTGDVDLFGERLAVFLSSSLRPHEWVALTLCDAKGATVRELPPLPGSRHEL